MATTSLHVSDETLKRLWCGYLINHALEPTTSYPTANKLTTESSRTFSKRDVNCGKKMKRMCGRNYCMGKRKKTHLSLKQSQIRAYILGQCHQNKKDVML